MNQQERPEAVRARQLAQEFPALLVLTAIDGALKLLSGPENGAFGADVEPLGVVQRSLIVVAQQARAAMPHHQVDALARIRAVSDDVAQAHGFPRCLGL